MLNILETVQEIRELLTTATSFKSAIDSLVFKIKDEIKADACSLFLINPDTQDFLLSASTRFEKIPENLWKIRRGDGLIGKVAQKGELLNIEDSQKDPANIDFPSHSFLQKNNAITPIQNFNDLIFHGFLGVPISYQGKLLGIIAAEKLTREKFSQEIVSFLVTLCSQIAEQIATQVSGSLTPQSSFLSGIPAASGVVVGEAVIFYPPADLSSIPDKPTQDADRDIERLLDAINQVSQTISELSKALENSLSKENQMLFHAYLQILQGNSFKGEIIKKIQSGQWVQSALKSVVTQMTKNFESMEDEYLQERASDIQDIGRRVLAELQSKNKIIRNFPSDTILIGPEITASMLAEVPSHKLKGVVSGTGSTNSHVAILAKALNIPAILSVRTLSFSTLDTADHQEIILDGYTGRVYLDPSDALKKTYQVLAEEEREMLASLKNLTDLPAETTDQKQIKLLANIGLISDLNQAIEAGAEGVGLYRTEIPFMVLERFPSEEEQRILYRQVLQTFSDHTVTMRVLDAGGDKILPYFHIKEENPSLGWRGIRMLLDHPEIFMTQIRAMIKASEGLNNLQIMLPMISKLSEIKEAKLLIHRAFEEVQNSMESKKNSEKNISDLNRVFDIHADPDFNHSHRYENKIEMPKIGAMIEVPSAIFQLEAILKHVDFISIGSNDLTQYMLAVDRNNARVERFYNSFHPSVLSAIAHIAKVTKQHQKPISICGELASSPLATQLLIGMGFDALSMSAAALPKIKWIIRGSNYKNCQQIVEKTLKMDRALTIRRYLQETLIEDGFGGLIRAGKN